ncbi:MAG: helix-turn-helix domain-containing protein [Muribaculaceae bacterium]
MSVALSKILDLTKAEHVRSYDNDIVLFNHFDVITLERLPWKLSRPLFAMCLQGSATVKVNLQEYRICGNELVTLMPDAIIHGYSFSDDFSGVMVLLSNSVAEELLPDITSVLPILMDFRQSPVIKLMPDEAKSLYEFYKFIWDKIPRVHGDYGKSELNGLLLSIFYEVLSVCKERYTYGKFKRTRNEETFYKFYSLIEKEYCRERSVVYFADRLCISPKHLSMVVKKVSGRTASDWIDDYVILQAKQLLRSSSLTIQEVSRELNFSNQSFFGKYFKKHVGMSPSEYRAKGKV